MLHIESHAGMGYSSSRAAVQFRCVECSWAAASALRLTPRPASLRTARHCPAHCGALLQLQSSSKRGGGTTLCHFSGKQSALPRLEGMSLSVALVAHTRGEGIAFALFMLWRNRLRFKAGVHTHIMLACRRQTREEVSAADEDISLMRSPGIQDFW